MTTQQDISPYLASVNNAHKQRRPRFFWKVTHYDTQSWEHPFTRDLIAVDSLRVIATEEELKRAVVNHAFWGSKEPSCFLSVFSDWRHAYNWAQKVAIHGSWAREPPVAIHTIESRLLPSSCVVLEMDSLKSVWPGPLAFHKHSQNEWIFLHKIPKQAITRTHLIRDDEHNRKNLLLRNQEMYAKSIQALIGDISRLITARFLVFQKILTSDYADSSEILQPVTTNEESLEPSSAYKTAQSTGVYLISAGPTINYLREAKKVYEEQVKAKCEESNKARKTANEDPNLQQKANTCAKYAKLSSPQLQHSQPVPVDKHPNQFDDKQGESHAAGAGLTRC